MKKTVLLSVLFTTATVLCSCDMKKSKDKDGGTAEIENTDLVASGTYEGKAKEVDAEEQEIYVEIADGKVLELYFDNATRLTKGGKTVAFTELRKGSKLKVTIENNDNSLKPVEVVILD